MKTIRLIFPDHLIQMETFSIHGFWSATGDSVAARVPAHKLLLALTSSFS